MKRSGPWSEEQTARFLAGARIPVRVACHGGAGHPLLASLWFTPEEGALWCATQRNARVARLLERDARCAFEVSVETPPYLGVRGTGVATLHPERGEEVLRRLLERYLSDPGSAFAQSLLARADRETAIRIEPRTLVSWDFRARMVDAP